MMTSENGQFVLGHAGGRLAGLALPLTPRAGCGYLAAMSGDHAIASLSMMMPRSGPEVAL